jgi:hypothetical protein
MYKSRAIYCNLWLISEKAEYIVNVVANKSVVIGNNRCNYGLIFPKLCGTIDYGNKKVTTVVPHCGLFVHK